MLLSGLYKTIIEAKMSEEKPRHHTMISPRQRMLEQTYNLNFGRQTGKTKAVVDSMFDNKYNYHSVYIGHNMRAAEDVKCELKARLMPFCDLNLTMFGRNVFSTKLFFFSSVSSIDRLRNLYYVRRENREGKIMVFVDEPMTKKDEVMEKLYAFFESTNYDPYFFVMGCQ